MKDNVLNNDNQQLIEQITGLFDQLQNLPYRDKTSLDQFLKNLKQTLSQIDDNPDQPIAAIDSLRFTPTSFYSTSQEYQESWQAGLQQTHQILSTVIQSLGEEIAFPMPTIINDKTAIEKNNADDQELAKQTTDVPAEHVNLAQTSQIDLALQDDNIAPNDQQPTQIASKPVDAIKELIASPAEHSNGKNFQQQTKESVNKLTVKAYVLNRQMLRLVKIYLHEVKTIFKQWQKKQRIKKQTALDHKIQKRLNRSAQKELKEQAKSAAKSAKRKKQNPAQPSIKKDSADKTREGLQTIQSASSAIDQPHQPLSSQTKIFLIDSGKDFAMNNQVFEALQNLGLTPISLNNPIHNNKPLLQKIDEHQHVGCAVILLSNDWNIYPKGEKPTNPAILAEPNTIFELGFWIGRLGKNNVIALYKEEATLMRPTKLFDAIYVEMDTNDSWKRQLAHRFEECGLLKKG